MCVDRCPLTRNVVDGRFRLVCSKWWTQITVFVLGRTQTTALGKRTCFKSSVQGRFDRGSTRYRRRKLHSFRFVDGSRDLLRWGNGINYRAVFGGWVQGRFWWGDLSEAEHLTVFKGGVFWGEVVGKEWKISINFNCKNLFFFSFYDLEKDI